MTWCDAGFISYGAGVASNKKERAFLLLSSLVPETGLEPAHQTAYAPKAYVYTNFTTRAHCVRPTLLSGLTANYIIVYFW